MKTCALGYVKGYAVDGLRLRVRRAFLSAPGGAPDQAVPAPRPRARSGAPEGYWQSQVMIRSPPFFSNLRAQIWPFGQPPMQS